MDDNSLVGVWRLVSWALTDKTGHRKFPYGEDAQGYLIYTREGFVSMHLAQAKRLPYQTTHLFEAAPIEAHANYQSYASYCGSYEVEGTRIVHRVALHTCPSWVGSKQERHFKLVRDRLHLTHPLDHWHSELVWER
jgi:hypothetical protein